jgi:hypothetical protein
LADAEDLLLHLEEEQEGLFKAKAENEVDAERNHATPEDTAEATLKTKARTLKTKAGTKP